MSASLLTEDCVRVGVHATDRTDLLARLSADLIAAGIARPTFTQALLDREARYPTGLPTRAIAVAIPHCDVEHVIRSAISVTRLAEPIPFHEMGANDRTVQVSLVIVMALSDKTSQLTTLQSLIGMLSDEARLNDMKNAPDAHHLFSIINEQISSPLAARP